MKRIAIIILSIAAALICISALSSSATGPIEQYIEKYSDIAVREMVRTGVPASITLAQGILESGAGRSMLATKAHNHFGIKCHKNWTGRKVYHDDDRKGECFRAYDNDEQSFRDHSDFLRYYDRYKSLFSNKPGDYKAWAYGLKAAGYATAPNYANSLISYIEKYNLSRFDNLSQQPGAQSARLPEAPLKLEEAKKVVKKTAASSQISETVDVTFSRLFTKNGVECVFALEGETYRDIASQYGLGLKKLLKFNELTCEQELLPGTVVYIAPKKNRAAKGLDKYIFGPEPESLRDVSQRFGVKLSAILKKNNIPADWKATEGDEILLR